ncbi:MAG TPA: 2Fe-2S iron-sulfur cluster-binding protein [Myxococcales bacterium]|jgi:sarcosine oxidase subunit alpha|nr:2Fe-2S iron-sulfur cluster-binding protein [Myxococcales bacterium]
MPRISLDGQFVEAEQGDTVAEALLRARITTFTRSIKYHRPRGPFCFTGSCGQCLMQIDGAPSQLACRTRVQEGMNCKRQNAPLGAGTDIFRAADFVFAEGLDHHHLMTGSRILGLVALEVARRLAGLGELPVAAQPAVPGSVRKARVVIVGAGPAGLAAARATGASALLIEREDRVGGAALLGLAPAPEAAAGEVLLGAECVGLYSNDTKLPGNALLAVRRAEGLLVIAAEQVIVANGAVPQPLAFPGVDRPGVYAARGLLGLKLRVGEKLVVAGLGDELRDCAAALRFKGYEVLREVQASSKLRAMGNPVRALEVDGERIRCDAVAIAAGPAPAHELASSVGAKARWDSGIGGFPVQVEADGRTSVPWLFAAGRVAGQGGSQAIASGTAAGTACRE